MSELGELLDRIEARKREGSLADEGWTAFGEGFARGSTVGAYDDWRADYLTSQEMQPDSPQGGFGPDPATTQMRDSPTYKEKKREHRQKSKQRAHDNPVASFMGEALGFVMPSSLGIKLGGGVLKGVDKVIDATKGARGKPPAKLMEGVQQATDTITGRTAKAGVGGAGEGALYNYNQGDNPLVGAGFGALFGMGGQALLGEALPAFNRTDFVQNKLKTLGWGDLFKQGDVMDEKVRARTANMIKEKIKTAFNHEELPEGVTLDEHALDRATDIMAKLGPEATIADVDAALHKLGLNLLVDESAVKNAGTYIRKIQERAKEAPSMFRKQMSKLLGNDRLYSKADVKKMAQEDFQRYSPAYKGVIDAASAGKGGQVFQGTDIRQLVTSAFEDADIPPVGDYRVLGEDLNKVLSEITGTKMGSAHDKVAKMTPKQLDQFKKYIDKQYEKVNNPANSAWDNGKVKVLASLRTAVNNALQDNVDGYKEINRKYSSTYMVNNAVDVADGFLKPGSDPADYIEVLHGFTPVEQDAFWQTVKYNMQRKLAKTRGDTKLAKDIAGSDDMQRKLEMLAQHEHDMLQKIEKVAGIDFANMLVESAKDASKFSDADKRTIKAWEKGKGIEPGGSIAGPIIDALTATSGLLTPAVSQAAGLGATRRLATQAQGMLPRMQEQASELLSQPQERLQDIFDMAAPAGPAISDFFRSPMSAILGPLQDQTNNDEPN